MVPRIVWIVAAVVALVVTLFFFRRYWRRRNEHPMMRWRREHGSGCGGRSEDGIPLSD
jgi:hypothetical protein